MKILFFCYYNNRCRHTAFGMFTAICGVAEILSPLFLDVIPRKMGQGKTGHDRKIWLKFLYFQVFHCLCVGVGCSGCVSFSLLSEDSRVQGKECILNFMKKFNNLHHSLLWSSGLFLSLIRTDPLWKLIFLNRLICGNWLIFKDYW